MRRARRGGPLRDYPQRYKKTRPRPGFDLLEGQIVDLLGDVAGRGYAGLAGGGSITFVATAGITTAVGAPAAKQLDALNAQGQRDAGCRVILRIRPHFGSPLGIYLCTFLEIGSDTGTIR